MKKLMYSQEELMHCLGINYFSLRNWMRLGLITHSGSRRGKTGRLFCREFDVSEMLCAWRVKNLYLLREALRGRGSIRAVSQVAGTSTETLYLLLDGRVVSSLPKDAPIYVVVNGQLCDREAKDKIPLMTVRQARESKASYEKAARRPVSIAIQAAGGIVPSNPEANNSGLLREFNRKLHMYDPPGAFVEDDSHGSGVKNLDPMREAMEKAAGEEVARERKHPDVVAARRKRKELE